MSFSVSTDIFCDGMDCLNWIHGASGLRSDRIIALKTASLSGWLITKGLHYCPECRQDFQKEISELMGKGYSKKMAAIMVLEQRQRIIVD